MVLLLHLGDVRSLDLLVEDLVVSLQFLIPPLEGIDPAVRIKAEVLELPRHGVFLHPLSFELRLILQQL